MSGEVEWIGTVLAPVEDRRPYGALRAPAAKSFEAIFGSRNDTGRYQALAQFLPQRLLPFYLELPTGARGLEGAFLDIHALYFSKDAVGIETAMHERMAELRVNIVNRRREFFRATPLEVKAHLAELAGELLQFQDFPEALEYRQCLTRAQTSTEPPY